jgi:hypothetical protein
MKFRRFLENLFARDVSYNVLEARQATKKGGILTLVSIVTMTAPKTFDGPASLRPQGGGVAGGAVLNSRPAAATTDIQESSPTSSDESQPSAVETSQDVQQTTAAATSAPAASSNPQTTAGPSSTFQVQSSATFGSAASSSASATSDATAPQKGGMTGGAKAGLAFGILLLLGALIAGIVLLYRRKKQQQEHEQLDDEKSAMARPDALPSHPEPALPPVPTQREPETVNAPQLSVRPVTQFDPRLSSALGPGAVAAGAAGAALAAKSVPRTPSPNSNSAWEKRGAERHANNPQNPFGNHAETLNNSPPNRSSPAGAALAAGAGAGALAAGAQRRAPSPGHIDAADFPLPVSGPPSPKPISLQSEGSGNTSSAGISSGPASSAASIPASLQVGEAALAVGAAAAAGGAIGAAAGKANGPNPDNVHRVQLDFKPSMEDELEIRAGQVVRMLHEYDDGWVGFFTSLKMQPFINIY